VDFRVSLLGGIRPFEQRDIPAVAALNWKFLQDRSDAPPPALKAFLRDLFFRSPFSDVASPSLIYHDDRGSVAGFLGVLARRMTLGSKPVRGAFGHGLVVHPESRSTMAGIRLLDDFMSGKQDLSITDTANSLSEKIWLGLGGSTALLYAMHWSYPLRPSLYAIHALARSRSGVPLAVLSALCRPFCTVVDGVAARSSGPFRRRPPDTDGEELNAETLWTCLSELPDACALRADYDVDSLSWLLDFMGRNRAYGTLRKVILRDPQKNSVGWYIYYANKHGVAQVVQVGAIRAPIGVVLDHLFYDAWKRGVIALHGRLDPQLVEGLSERRCFFYLGNRFLVHSRNPELARLVQSGSALLTRLDGEWCLRFGDQSSQACPDRATWEAPSLSSPPDEEEQIPSLAGQPLQK
jgi:hypothetical protein